MAGTPITVAHGDGIGPEIMEASLFALREAGASLDVETISIGESVYLKGQAAGIEPESWDSLRRTRVFYKAPITTPQGGGFKSLNVTVRKTLGLYANVRPCVAYAPFVRTKYPGMNVVIVRENEEDVYGGIEYRQTNEMYECLKLISRPGSEKIIRYAFEYARINGRKKVTCFAKDNIMKMTDGLFHAVFDEVATEYPQIEHEFWIVDIGAAKLSATPEAFDVVVMPNLYGDILSDVAAQIAGSVGLAGSANIGDHLAMFEAIHGSAPRHAGQNRANPSGLLLGGVMMLVHLGQAEAATRLHNAWLRTLEDGIHTADIYTEGTSVERVGTREFAQAIVARLGQEPQQFKPVAYRAEAVQGPITIRPTVPAHKELVGVDVFVDWQDRNAEKLAALLQPLDGTGLQLNMLTNRGVRTWPHGYPETFLTDHTRCRYYATDRVVMHEQVAALLGRLAEAGIDFIKTEHLYHFDGQPAFSVEGES